MPGTRRRRVQLRGAFGAEHHSAVPKEGIAGDPSNTPSTLHYLA
jgi:hypothetical protein